MTATLRERLRAGEPLLGTFVKSPDPSVAELLGESGLDFLLADYEHSSLSVADVETIVRASAAPVVVRLAADALHETGRMLDAGAAGIQVSDVRDVATAADACARASYPPTGRRGLAFSHRAARFGREGRAAHVERAAAERIVICQIESVEGAAALPALLAAELEVDAWFIGPTDLSASLGFPGQLDAAPVREAIDAVASAVTAAGARLGVFAHDVDEAKAWTARGATFLATGSDHTLLARQIDAILARWRRTGDPAVGDRG
jgi:4-hydroxy-2-oxoheptanedioate aldolase